MSESGTDSALVRWSVPECPFTIEYSSRAMDDIRLAVTDAFFSLPRGGAEIGGILLGQFDGTRLAITDYAALECEHAFGPSFQISLNDEARLKQLLAATPQNFPGLQTVGWYHSHTRSGIFLSAADLEIHNSYFSEPWQVALVMKPHTFEPTRIGFFFREPDGRVHAEASYKETELAAQAMRQVPAGPPPETAHRPGGMHRERARRMMSQVELETTAEVLVTEPAATAAAPPPPPVLTPKPKLPVRPVASEPVPAESEAELPVPQFLTQQAPPSSRGRRMVGVVLGALVTLGAIGAALVTRDAWVPKFMAAVRPATPAKVPPPSLGLRTADRDGQLEISWDRTSPAVMQATGGVLEINDSGPLQLIPLDMAHLQAGTFSYGRQSEKVDVKLILRGADDQTSRQVTSFLGKLPARKPPEESEELRKQREAMAAQAAKMKLDLNWQAVKTKKLEKELQSMKDEMKQQQQKRMANQLPDGKQ